MSRIKALIAEKLANLDERKGKASNYDETISHYNSYTGYFTGMEDALNATDNAEDAAHVGKAIQLLGMEMEALNLRRNLTETQE